MATSRKIDGDKVEHGELVGGDDGVTYNRPTRTYYNRYGEPHVLPADPAQMIVLIEQGWFLQKPEHPAKKPRFQVMRDGSHYEFGITTQDLSDVEKARMRRLPTDIPVTTQATATYYTAEGTPIPNLPADPASMAEYLKSGLSLNPPKVTAGLKAV